MILSPVTGSFLLAISTMLARGQEDSPCDHGPFKGFETFVDASTKSNQASYYMRKPLDERDNVRTINEILKRQFKSPTSLPGGEIFEIALPNDHTTVPSGRECQSVTTPWPKTRKMKKDRSDNINYDNVLDFLYTLDLLENDDRLQRDGNWEVE